MLRPLLITENFPPGRGGMAQSCDRIVRGLRARGVCVDVVHLGARGDQVHVEQHEHGRLIRCPVNDDPAHALNLLWNVLGRDTQPATHVLAFGGLVPLLCGPAFAAWLQLPLITLLRGNDFDTGVFSLRRGWMLREAIARAAVVCTVSTDQRRKISALYPGQRVLWIPNGIDCADWNLLDMDRAAAREWRAANVAPTRRVIGLLGHLKRKKGGAFLLDALQGCVHAGRAHLLVVGEAEPEMLARLQALPPEIAWSHIAFTSRFDLLRWYAACDAVAIPSLYDGMPNVLLEAGALGIPVLGSSAGGLADVLADCAMTFAPGDLHACRRALDLTLEMPATTLCALGGQLQQIVRQRFEQHSEATRYHEVLADTAAHVPPRRDTATVSMENEQ
jgi:glycosyltransferase involved in cell wall biosynthesis